LIIYLVRHATPDWARIDIPYSQPPGPPLTPQGETEAAELGVFLQQAGVGQVYASPFDRTRRTAELAAAAAGIPVVLEPALTEWRPGETEADVRARLAPFWQRLIAGAPPAPVALVTHGGPIAVLLADLGMDQAVLAHHRRLFDRNNPLPPAGVWQAVRPQPGGAWELTLAYMPEHYRKSDYLV
jgi:probable phosphoglycerate mutase